MTTQDRSTTERQKDQSETRTSQESRAESLPKEGELLIIRELDAPRARVWQMLTVPDLIQRWWGPKDFTAPQIKMDLRVGGVYHFCMRSPEGQDVWSTGTIRELIPQQRLAVIDSFADATGKIVPASYYGMDSNFPLKMYLTYNLIDIGNKTRLTLLHAGFPSDAECEAAQQGWGESLDKLVQALKH